MCSIWDLRREKNFIVLLLRQQSVSARLSGMRTARTLLWSLYFWVRLLSDLKWEVSPN